MGFTPITHGSSLGGEPADIAVNLDDIHSTRKAAEQVAQVAAGPTEIVFAAGVLGSVTNATSVSVEEVMECVHVNALSLKPFIDATIHSQEHVRYWLVSSGAAQKPYPAMLSYCVSKAAAEMLFRTYASEFRTHSFVAVNPGPMFTRMNEQIQSSNVSGFPELAKFSDPELVAQPAIRARQLVDHLTQPTNPGFTELDLRSSSQEVRSKTKQPGS